MKRLSPDLSLAALGLLALLQEEGSAEIPDLASTHDDFTPQIVENLCEQGLVTVSGDKVFYVDEDIATLKKEFDRFRVAYPGTKRGLDPEWDDFRKKNKKTWRSAVSTLLENLMRQVDERAAVKRIIEQKERAGDRSHGLFLPAWQNLKTYLGNQEWTRKYVDTPPPAPGRQRDELVRESVPDAAHSKYLFWAKGRFDVDMAAEDPRLLSAAQMSAWVNKSDVFEGIQYAMSETVRKAFFHTCHNEYFGETTLQRKFVSVYNYMAAKLREQE